MRRVVLIVSFLIIAAGVLFYLGGVPTPSAVRDFFAARAQLDQEQAELDRARAELGEAAAENAFLRSRLGVEPARGQRVILARVLWGEPRFLRARFVIDQGRADGVEAGAAVFSADATVRKVFRSPDFHSSSPAGDMTNGANGRFDTQVSNRGADDGARRATEDADISNEVRNVSRRRSEATEDERYLGRVQDVSERKAVVETVFHPSSRVFARTASGRSAGVVRGWFGTGLRFDGISQAGGRPSPGEDVVVTSEGFSDGFRLGTIERVEQKTGDTRFSAELEPAIKGTPRYVFLLRP